MTSHQFVIPESPAVFDRHQKVDSICERLHRILAGRSAEVLLAEADASGGASLPDFGRIAVLPSWTWLHSRVNVGRKDRGDDGRRLLLPVRAMWSPGSVVVVAEGTDSTLNWTAVGMGHTGMGTCEISANASGSRYDESDQGMNTPPKVLNLSPESRMSMHRELEHIVTDGRQAWWDLMMDIEIVLERALHRAHAHISAEIAGTDFQTADFNAVLDPIGLQTVKDKMSVGDEDTTSTVIERLIEKCLTPTTFLNVEPTRYINITLDRDSKAAIRKAIGDPHVGPKIRKLAREVGHTDLPLLVSEYNKQHPADRLSTRRAAAALTVQPDPMANRTNYEDIDESHSHRQVRSNPVFRTALPPTPKERLTADATETTSGQSSATSGDSEAHTYANAASTSQMGPVAAKIAHRVGPAGPALRVPNSTTNLGHISTRKIERNA